MTDLTNTVTVVTGGRKGVGLGLALEAAKRGSRVVIASISDASEAVDRIRAEGGQASWFQADVSDVDQVAALADHVRTTVGAVNILINNAAVGDAAGSIFDNEPRAIIRTLEVNLLGYIWTIRAFADDLRANAANGERSYILNVGSEHSLAVPPHVTPLSAYTITKQSELAVTNVARRDLHETGVKVALLAPGWVLTEEVRRFITNSPEAAEAIMPYAQETGDVARIAFDDLLDDRELIVTNAKSVQFARDHAYRLLADLARAENREMAESGWSHDGTGDPDKCPVAHLLPGT